MKKKWFGGLQALRGILFLMVFISHSGGFVSVPGLWGGYAVCAFFVLSGFLSGYAYKRKTGGIIKECIVNLFHKIKSFWLLYFVFTIVAFVVMKNGTVKDLLRCSLLLQSYFGDANTALRLNWPGWFLSSIMLSYLLSPVLNKIVDAIFKKSKVICGIVGIGILVGLFIWAYVWKNDYQAYGGGYYWIYICPLSRMFDFIMGIIMAQFYKETENKKISFEFSSVLEGGVIVILLALMVKVSEIPNPYVYQAITVPLFLAVIWIFARCDGILTRWCSENKFLMYCGKRSFELFIIHRVVLWKLVSINSSIVFWGIALLVTIVLAESWCKLNELFTEYRLKRMRE